MMKHFFLSDNNRNRRSSSPRNLQRTFHCFDNAIQCMETRKKDKNWKKEKKRREKEKYGVSSSDSS